jgi:predicted ATPase
MGQIAGGLLVIEEAIEQCEHNSERWITAELRRVKGTLVQMQGGAGAATSAEEHFCGSLDFAHRQGALSWELRAAISIAQLWRDQDRISKARALLSSVFERFTEGFDTADLQSARRLLSELREASGSEQGFSISGSTRVLRRTSTTEKDVS